MTQNQQDNQLKSVQNQMIIDRQRQSSIIHSILPAEL